MNFQKWELFSGSATIILLQLLRISIGITDVSELKAYCGFFSNLLKMFCSMLALMIGATQLDKFRIHRKQAMADVTSP